MKDLSKLHIVKLMYTIKHTITYYHHILERLALASGDSPGESPLRDPRSAVQEGIYGHAPHPQEPVYRKPWVYR